MHDRCDATRRLGRTGIATDAVSIGTSGLGAKTTPGGQRRAVDVAREILQGPFRLIDTANAYAGGRSEAVLGEALASVPDAGSAGEASRIVTKVDRDPITGAFDADRVRRSYDESRERLGVDRVALLHLHDPGALTLTEATARHGALEALVALREGGEVDAIGVAFGAVPKLRAWVRSGAFDVLLNHNRFTLVDRSAQSLFREARDRGMGVFNAAPFGGGLLSTSAMGRTRAATYAYQPVTPQLLAWVDRVERVCRQADVSLPAVALAFSTRSDLVDTTVVGVSSPGRVAALAELCDVEIPDGVWEEIERIGTPPTTVQDDPGEAE